MSNPWLRLYADFASNPVVQSLAFEDQRHFIVLLCLKCDGTLDRPSAKTVRDRIICRGLGLDPMTAAEAKRRLREVGLVDEDWQPTGWNKRQFLSDNSTDRVRKYRKNKKPGNVPETPSGSSGNNNETPPEADTEADTEADVSAELRGSPSRARARRLDSSSALPNDWRLFIQSERPDLNPDQTWNEFQRYFTVGDGQDTERVDWYQTWVKWVRREQQRAKPNGRSKQSSTMSAFQDAAWAELQRRHPEIERPH